jgi:hypothetical protein
MVLSPNQNFSDESNELAKNFDCKVELTFDVSKVKNIDTEALNIFEQNLKMCRPYVRIATKTGECNRCHLNLEWRCDNSIISYKTVYGVNQNISEGCAFYYQNLGEENFNRFLEIAKELQQVLCYECEGMWHLNKEIVQSEQIVFPLVYGDDGLFVWNKLMEAYRA